MWTPGSLWATTVMLTKFQDSKETVANSGLLQRKTVGVLEGCAVRAVWGAGTYA